jgi:hypothetical protein
VRVRRLSARQSLHHDGPGSGASRVGTRQRIDCCNAASDFRTQVAVFSRAEARVPGGPTCLYGTTFSTSASQTYTCHSFLHSHCCMRRHAVRAQQRRGAHLKHAQNLLRRLAARVQAPAQQVGQLL